MKKFKEILEAIRVDTEKYRASHGKNPKGSGQWIFKIAGKEQGITGSYASAKKQAQEIAKKKGETFIIVMP